jgi:hypothetical protein
MIFAASCFTGLLVIGSFGCSLVDLKNGVKCGRIGDNAFYLFILQNPPTKIKTYAVGHQISFEN